MPKLSVITVNLNNKAGLEKTMRSVLNQTYTDLEYIVIDGASSDGSSELIKKIDSEFSSVSKISWISEKDSGIYQAMNKGIAMAYGEYLLFLNSGDSLIRNTILMSVFEDGFTEDYVYGDLDLYKNGELCYTDVSVDFEKPLFSKLYTHNLPHQASFIKRELFKRFGCYDESLRIVSDWEFCIRVLILHTCSVKHINITISNYAIDGISGINNDICETERELVLNKYFPPRVLGDYKRITEYRNDIELINWFNSSGFYKQLLLFIYKTGRKCEKAMDKIKNGKRKEPEDL